jgi:hypothetical protein
VRFDFPKKRIDGNHKASCDRTLKRRAGKAHAGWISSLGLLLGALSNESLLRI